MAFISWERKLELYGIAAARASTIIPQSLPKVCHDESAPADVERLVFTATTGNQDPPDAQIYDTELLVELRSTNRNAEQLDEIWAEIEKSFQKPAALIVAMNLFPAGLWFLDERSENDRSDSPNTRKRSRRFFFSVGHIEGAEPPVPPQVSTYLRPDGTFTYHRPDGISIFTRP